METLVAGNTGYWNRETLKKAFGDSHIVIAGTDISIEKESGIVSFPVSVSDERFEDIFMNYNFDRVVYFSDYLTLHGKPEAEMESLRLLLRLCKIAKTEQIVFLESAEQCADILTGKSIILKSEEELCHYYVEKQWLTIKMIRIPYLCSGRLPNDYFYRFFRRCEEENKVEIWESPNQKTNFISMEDLAEFLFRLFDAWDGKTETINLFSYSRNTFSHLADWAEKKFQGIVVQYTNKSPYYELDLGENTVRTRFGWFATKDVVEDIDILYEDYCGTKIEKLPPWKRVRERIMSVKSGLLIVELLVGCIVAELLTRFLSAAPQFSTIDVRLLFIVLMGGIYGMNAGMAAAFLEIVAMGYTYMERGLNWQFLFYEPSNWVPFILYFTAGAVCGYVKYRNDDVLEFLKKENKLILDKFRFITTLYHEALDNKSEYKKQIIGSRDSFGKIFEVVKHLDTVIPQEIYAEAITVMEDVLDNHSIAIYSIRDSRAFFGRLEVSSRNMEYRLPKSIRLEQFTRAMETVESGEIWINTELLPDYPMYMAGLKDKEGIILLIMIYRAEYDQMGMYYANLFRIICGLIENSFLKAWRYQEAVRDKIYIEDTAIVKENYFLEQLSLRHNMLEEGISSYALIKIHTGAKTIREMDELLRTKVRETDLLGMGEDGNLYLLLSQADEVSVGIVLNRLSSLGIHCVEVKQMGSGA